MTSPLWQWLSSLLLVPVFIPIVRWVVKSAVRDMMEGHNNEKAASDLRMTGTVDRIHARIDGTERWQVAHDAVESERRRVREDTRGVPVTDEGRKGRVR